MNPHFSMSEKTPTTSRKNSCSMANERASPEREKWGPSPFFAMIKLSIIDHEKVKTRHGSEEEKNTNLKNKARDDQPY